MSSVRTRFAPSPTGFLHIGGIRTALYAWLLARKTNGSILLRIEDTDQERFVAGAIEGITKDLSWLGILPDEGPSLDELRKVEPNIDGANTLSGDFGPYIQSLRRERHEEIAEKLIELGYCYRCDCTSEMLQKEREQQAARKEPPGYAGRCRERDVKQESKHVIRFKIPSGRSITLHDAVKGEVTWDNVPLRDSVLLKSDRFPTYHLASVVDDHDMNITHVIRGDEWLATTPLHLLIYEALGWQAPVFAHVPPVLGSDGKKLSKRHGATSVNSFREAGYLPEALLNFLALIGWSPGDGDEQEIFTREELIQKFSLEHVNKAPGVFAYEKLNWLNGMFIRALPADNLRERLRPYLIQAGLIINEQRLETIVPHIQERMETLLDAVPLVEFLFKDQIEREIPDMFKKGIDKEKALIILNHALAALRALPSFDTSAIEGALRPLVAELQFPAAALFGVIRIAVTGRKVTPPLFESLHALGRAETLKRIEDTLSILGGRSV